MKIILTGATGFIGSHMARHALSIGAEVWAVVRKGTSRWRLDGLEGDLTLVEADLREAESIRQQLPDAADLCFHFAWEGWSGTSSENALGNIASLSFSASLLQTLAIKACRRIVVAGTCLEYGPTETRITEQTSCAPTDLYGITKNGLSEVAMQFCSRVGVELAWARIFYCYGPFEDSRRLVPSIASPLLEGRVAHATSGAQVRDYLHVQDVVSAIWCVAKSHHVGAVNIASGSAVTVGEIASRVAREIGRPDLLKLGALPHREGEPQSLTSDPRILRDMLGWSPAFTLDAGLASTVDWWRRRKQ